MATVAATDAVATLGAQLVDLFATDAKETSANEVVNAEMPFFITAASRESESGREREGERESACAKRICLNFICFLFAAFANFFVSVSTLLVLTWLKGTSFAYTYIYYNSI